MYIAASGAIARMRELDVVSHNLANANTTAFKTSRPVFESALESSLQDRHAQLQAGVAGRSFVDTYQVAHEFEEGSAIGTGAPLDVAILGEGFLEVETPGGLRYTRAGSLMLDEQGVLTTRQGYPVMGSEGAIQSAGSQLRIGAGGEVFGEDGSAVGKIKVVAFDEVSWLAKEGRHLFVAPEAAGKRAVERPSFAPESLESSNVDPVSELSALVLLQRSFQANLKTLTAGDEATEKLLREVGR